MFLFLSANHGSTRLLKPSPTLVSLQVTFRVFLRVLVETDARLCLKLDRTGNKQNKELKEAESFCAAAEMMVCWFSSISTTCHSLHVSHHTTSNTKTAD